MVKVHKLEGLIREYLPNADYDTINRITNEIAREIELEIYSLVRRAVQSERANKT
jgi:hypothetical protein